MSSVALVDVLQRPVPWWLGSLLSADSTHLSRNLFLTTGQRMQVGTMIFASSESEKASYRREGFGCITAHSPAVVQAMLTHGRFYRVVTRNHGDVTFHVDTADFLSHEGRALTTVQSELELLHERTRQHHFASPFWLSEAQARHICAYRTMRQRLRWVGDDVAQLFQKPGLHVELSSGLSEFTRYINTDALCSSSPSAKGVQMCLSAFRCFTPINVRTKQRFDATVEICLRVECLHSGCWCSVWGTAEDYASCGFRALDGALGVDVFDELGNPAFLICALCTTAPLEVYAACYPNDSICASHPL